MDPRDKFIELIDLEKCRVLLAPQIIFICGGEVDVSKPGNHSVRNMFMNLSGKMPGKTKGFTLAENFKDWQTGYSSLSEFENDIAALSAVIVVIVESAGSIAELGLFFANEHLRKKMIVVVHSGHHREESFIKFGLLDPLETASANSVLVYDLNTEKVEEIKEDEVIDLLEEVCNISEKLDGSAQFSTLDHGHKLFLMFQIIDLFSILTSAEIEKYFGQIGIKLEKRELRAGLYILEKFQLLRCQKKSSQTFYFTDSKAPKRVDLAFKRDLSDPDKPRRYDSAAIRLETLQYYQKSKKDRTFSRRLSLWENRDGGDHE